jgi:hypothetical protein
MAKSKNASHSPAKVTAGKSTPPYELTVDLQVLRHLGIGLYSNVPAVVSEMVANAYDADAETVDVNVKDDEIVIKDDGLGMSVSDANAKFLTVGYDKRAHETETPKLYRKPMGRKGIGKLSAFAIAEKVQIQSIKSDPKTEKEIGRAAFVMDVGEIEKEAKAKKPYYPSPLSTSDFDFDKGTRIVLTLRKKRSVNPEYIRINLARRFSVIGRQFEVLVNTKRVTPAERQYRDKLQFVWGLGSAESFNLAKKGKRVRNTETLPNSVKIVGGADETVTGWIGTVHLPKDLKEGPIDNNGIVVMARGKLVHENLLPFARTAKIFKEYVVGEINADWLDDEDLGDDMATSGRQSLKEDEPRFLALQSFAKDSLEYIAERWTVLRKKAGLEDAIEKHPVLQNWLDLMTPDNRKDAEKLISTIQGMPVADEDDRKVLLKHGVMAFETLTLKGNLSALEEMPIDNVEGFKQILAAMEDLEIAHYYQIAKSRWTILKRFEELIDENAKEKFLQQEIYDHPWLMDAAWERATNDIEKEKRFYTKLKAKKLGKDRNSALARYDIKYLTVSGKDLIVELKRSGVRLTADKIYRQVMKYADIMRMNKDADTSETIPFEIIVLVGDYPAGYGSEIEDSLKPFRAKIMTYSHLIDRAYLTYGDYLDRQKKVDRIQKLVDLI